MIRRLLREPLLHFAVLGAALFAAYAVLAPAASGGSAIVVSADQIASISARFRATWQRPPSSEELAALIENHIREEVLYREGLALGLDLDDPVIRNRVKQKMEIFSEDAMSVEPTDADLQQYMDAHRQVFELPAPMTFEQVYFDPEKRGERLASDTRRALDELRAGRSAGGDATLLPQRMDRAQPADISSAFGPGFEAVLREAPVGQWSEARSSFGSHVVRVIWRGAATMPTLADARDVVRREWTRAHTVSARDRLYRSLRERYTITVAPLPSSAPPSGGRP